MTACAKHTYASREDAEQSAALLTAHLAETGRSRRERRKKMNAYQCPRCRGWHLSKQRPKGRNR